MNEYTEVNFDGLVGPTHHFGGLSYGNIASIKHRSTASNPRAAALQGLKKMHTLASRGIPQAVLPPVQRPNLELLRLLGFTGGTEEQVRACAEQSPELFSAVWSASSMWTANAATVCPSADTRDRRLHLVPANLASHFHRSTEARSTRDILRRIFANPDLFSISDPLPCHPKLGDEGAANHTRFYAESNAPGLHFFIYGASVADEHERERKFPARQTETASRAVARMGHLDADRCVFAQQSAEAINAGVFHNDVIAVGGGNLLFCHEQAFVKQEATLAALRSAFQKACGGELRVIEVPKSVVSLDDAVHSYLCNSQMIRLSGDGDYLLVVPLECSEHQGIRTYLDRLTEEGGCPIKEVLVQNVRESMRNGGGPACLRLRVTLSEAELAGLGGRVLLDDSLYENLGAWVERHYREHLVIDTFLEPGFVAQTHAAFLELEGILELPGLCQ
jgi:succinylarginine dihydrolase